MPRRRRAYRDSELRQLLAALSCCSDRAQSKNGDHGVASREARNVVQAGRGAARAGEPAAARNTRALGRCVAVHRWRCPSCGPRPNLALLNDKEVPWPGVGCPAARLVARAPVGTRAPGTGTVGERMQPDHPFADRGRGEVPPGGERLEAGPGSPRTSPRRRCAAGRRRRRPVRSRRVPAGHRQRRRSCHSGKGRATKRAGPGRRPVHGCPMWSARDLPRPAPHQRPGPAYGLVLLGDPPSFDEDDSDPHCCVKPLDAVALPSLAATAACRNRHGPPASCSAPMVSRLRCLLTVRQGMPP